MLLDELNPEQTVQPEVEPVVETNPTTAPEVKPDPAVNPMKELRSKYESEKQKAQKYESVLKRLADQEGVSIEEYENKIQEEEDKRTATQRGIPVDVQQQLRSLQEKSAELERENFRRDFEYRLKDFSSKYNLSQEQNLEFANEASRRGINITSPGVDLTATYRAVNYDTIIKTEREAMRQQILKELNKSRADGNTIQVIPGATTSPQQAPVKNDEEFIKNIFKSARGK